MKQISKFIIMVAVTAFSCSPSSKNDKHKMMRPDIHSYALPQQAIVKHVSLDLNVDFDKKQLSGTATLDIDNVTKGKEIHLDTRGLIISGITLDDGSATTFELKKEEPYLGSELIVGIRPETSKITITYSTSPDAAALQWLAPEQTAGGRKPFLFTQSQAILARTWIPLQDSPGIRFTYEATIQCPKDLMAVMSANNDTMKSSEGIYHFEMPQAIPSYLMALAVGDLSFKGYDNRSGVFAEPITLEKAAYEFEDMPKMISAAEELYGPYAWGRYDVLVLPPSFPFGGMENPRITFATPTILAGDRSLVALIAHELAHSWSGNLVTNATWNDFWLNEGFTVYFETRIMEKLYGKPYADMLTFLSKGELLHTIDDFGKEHEDTKLYLNLAGRDPDEGVSDIAYEKGRFFLTTIEKAVGRDKWDAFVKKYFTEHAFQSMTTEKFLKYLDKELIKGDETLKSSLRINDWVFGPGLPSNCVEVSSEELLKSTTEADAFISGKTPSQLNINGWTTHHWLQFLRHLPDSLSQEQMIALDKQFHFTESGNAEIKCDWLQIAIRSKYETAYPALEKFLISVGRRKFLKPLYIAMTETPEGKVMADAIYKKARPGYHAVSYHTIDEILK